MKRRSWTDPGDPETMIDLTDIIDEGASGAVFEGVYKGERVAVKVIPGLEDPAVNTEVRDEVKILKKLAPSPQFVGIRGVWEKEEHAWIAMEMCDAGSAIDLCQICQTNLQANECAAVAASVLLALKFLHETLGIVHRDIKGKNILFTRDGKVKLTDLGIAVISPEKDPKSKPLPAGSPHWMAPELASKNLTCYANDIWSLGITLIELVAGEPPHSNVSPGEVLKVIEDSAPPLFGDEIRKSLGVDLPSFLAACVVKDPAKRPNAAKLLRHPYVDSCVMHLMVSDKPEPTMKTLVERALPIIFEYRDFERLRRLELAEQSEKQKSSPAKSQQTKTAATQPLPPRSAPPPSAKPKQTWSEADGDLVVLEEPPKKPPPKKWSEADGDLVILDEVQATSSSKPKVKWSEAEDDLFIVSDDNRHSVKMEFMELSQREEKSSYQQNVNELNAHRARRRPESIQVTEKLVQSRQSVARRKSEVVRESDQVKQMQARLAQIQSRFDKQVSNMKKVLPKEAFQ